MKNNTLLKVLSATAIFSAIAAIEAYNQDNFVFAAETPVVAPTTPPTATTPAAVAPTTPPTATTPAAAAPTATTPTTTTPKADEPAT